MGGRIVLRHPLRMKRKFLVLCPSLSIFLLLAPACKWGYAQAHTPAAQASGQGTAKVSRIAFSGSSKLSDGQLLAASGLKVGDMVGKADLQAAADRMSALGLFASVSFSYKTGADGVELQFVVREAPTFPVDYDNFPWFSDDEINTAVRAAVPFYGTAAPGEGQMVDLMAQAIQKLLPSRAVFGQVRHDVLQRPDGAGPFLQFSVAGSAVQLEKLNFTDAFAGTSGEITTRMSDLIGKPYSRYAIDLFAYEEVRPAYLASGRLKVTFGQPSAELSGSSASSGQKVVIATLPISPGPVYMWGGVTWSGNAALSVTALNSMVDITPNSPADGNKIQAMWLAVSRAYAHIGYEDSAVEPEAQFDDATARVKYAGRITEGPQYHMGELIVTGLSVDAEKHLRLAWTMDRGSVFDDAYFEQFYDKLARPTAEIFDNLPVHYEKTGQLQRKNTETHTIDVLLDFQ
jgi:outer membrane protein assembly factor BamA